ncbi:MAG: DNA double-strand break repair nuclease NurA [Chloroflexota bacterium]
MPLDLATVVGRMSELAAVVARRRTSEDNALVGARELLHRASNPAALAAKILAARTPWRAGLPLEPLANHTPAPPLPAEWSVLASDGSTAEPDRHGVALCYLVNIGLVSLHYGVQPLAVLHNEPHLGFDDSDLYVAAGEQRVMVSGPVLSIYRQALEGERLVAFAASTTTGPAVALQDGTLLLATLEGAGLEQWLQNTLLPRVLDQYEQLRQRRLPLASYTSRPRHTEVSNALRILACPAQTPECRAGCRFEGADAPTGAQLCWALADLPDRTLWQGLLAIGERSAVCRSLWSLSERYYGAHRVHFFYLNVGEEIARVEVPEWVALDQRLLGLVQGAILDQCERGRGYPSALIEAHEQAVLRASERQQFNSLLENALASAGLPLQTSRKEHAKRLRAL